MSELFGRLVVQKFDLSATHTVSLPLVVEGETSSWVWVSTTVVLCHLLPETQYTGSRYASQRNAQTAPLQPYVIGNLEFSWALSADRFGRFVMMRYADETTSETLSYILTVNLVGARLRQSG